MNDETETNVVEQRKKDTSDEERPSCSGDSDGDDRDPDILRSCGSGVLDAYHDLEDGSKVFMEWFLPIFWLFFPFFAIMFLINWLLYQLN